jgi:hypothetical protein
MKEAAVLAVESVDEHHSWSGREGQRYAYGSGHHQRLDKPLRALI